MLSPKTTSKGITSSSHSRNDSPLISARNPVTRMSPKTSSPYSSSPSRTSQPNKLMMLSPNATITTPTNQLNSNAYASSGSHSNTNSDYSSSYGEEDEDDQRFNKDEEIEDENLIESPTIISSSITTDVEKKSSALLNSSDLGKLSRRCISYNLLPTDGSSQHLKPNNNETKIALGVSKSNEPLKSAEISSTPMVSLSIEGPGEQTLGSNNSKHLQTSTLLPSSVASQHNYPFLSKSTSSSNLLSPPPALSRRNSMYSVTSGRSRGSSASGHLGSLVSSPRLVNTFQKLTEQRKTLKNDPTFDNHLFEYESSLISDTKTNLKPYVYGNGSNDEEAQQPPEEQLGQLGKEYATGMDPKSVMLLCDLKRNGKKIGNLLDDMERTKREKHNSDNHSLVASTHDTSIKSKVERTMQMIKSSLEQLNHGKSKKKQQTKPNNKVTP